MTLPPEGDLCIMGLPAGPPGDLCAIGLPAGPGDVELGLGPPAASWAFCSSSCFMRIWKKCIAWGQISCAHPSLNSSASACTSWYSASTKVLISDTRKCISSVSIPFLYRRSIELPSFCRDNIIGIVLTALRINNFFNSSKSLGLLGSSFSFASK